MKTKSGLSQPLAITVMLGGPSQERDVSLRSGQAVAEALISLGHRVSKVDPASPGWQLPDATDVVFLALHGTYGEDGTIQAELEAMGVPYTGCGPEASRVAFDKVLTKQRCEQAGVNTPRYRVLDSAGAPWPEGWAPPVVLKPVCQGSSLGLRFVRNLAEWAPALDASLGYDQRVLMEEMIEGRETTVGILAGRALPIVEVRPKLGVYDYQNKYTAGVTDYFCPASFDAGVTGAIQAAALAALEAIGGGSYARVDVMVNPEGRPFVLEVNTLPGMTETSLLPKAAAAAGIPFPALCECLVELALRETA